MIRTDAHASPASETSVFHIRTILGKRHARRVVQNSSRRDRCDGPRILGRSRISNVHSDKSRDKQMVPKMIELIPHNFEIVAFSLNIRIPTRDSVAITPALHTAYATDLSSALSEKLKVETDATCTATPPRENHASAAHSSVARAGARFGLSRTDEEEHRQECEGWTREALRLVHRGRERELEQDRKAERRPPGLNAHATAETQGPA